MDDNSKSVSENYLICGIVSSRGFSAFLLDKNESWQSVSTIKVTKEILWWALTRVAEPIQHAADKKVVQNDYARIFRQ